MMDPNPFIKGQRVKIRDDDQGRFVGYLHSGLCTVRVRQRGFVIERVVHVADVAAMATPPRGSQRSTVTVECVPANGRTPALFSIFVEDANGGPPATVAIRLPIDRAVAAFNDQLEELADLARCTAGTP